MVTLEQGIKEMRRDLFDKKYNKKALQEYPILQRVKETRLTMEPRGKNFTEKCPVLTVEMEGCDQLTPKIYFNIFNEGCDVDELKTHVITTLTECFEEYPERVNAINKFDITDFECIKSRIFLRLFNKERSKKNINPMDVYSQVGTDILGFYSVHIDENHSMPIQRGILDIWDITIDELSKLAEDTFMERFENDKIKLISILEMLLSSGYISEEEAQEDFGEDEGPSHLYFTADVEHPTRSTACIIGYKRALDKIYNDLDQENFYVIPSSIYECLVMPERFAPDDPNELKKMVVLVNYDSNALRDEEILADNVYHYDGASQELTDSEGNKIVFIA